MPKFDFVVSANVQRTARVMQLEGLFELPPTQRSEVRWAGEIPIDTKPWSIGMIVGPSGAGKTTLAKQLFGKDLITGFDWSHDKSILDDFPSNMGIKDVTGLLSQVGFSTPPAWMRPFRLLSNGEQFRVTLARAMAESDGMFVIDEFTSVVDRTVAQIGSAALSRAMRRGKRKMIAVGVHYDVIDWLQPDWIYEPHLNKFQWRELQKRPAIELEVVPCHYSAWEIFKRHHYLDTNIHRAAKCFCAIYDGRPVAFAAVMMFPHPIAPRWRGHRTVCLPDFQGVGIGNALSEFIASAFRATGKPFSSVTANPAMIAHRAKSPLWKMRSAPKLGGKATNGTRDMSMDRAQAWNRITASFDFVGPSNHEAAKQLGIIK